MLPFQEHEEYAQNSEKRNGESVPMNVKAKRLVRGLLAGAFRKVGLPGRRRIASAMHRALAESWSA
jgi:hypothetical protein